MPDSDSDIDIDFAAEAAAPPSATEFGFEEATPTKEAAPEKATGAKKGKVASEKKEPLDMEQYRFTIGGACTCVLHVCATVCVCVKWVCNSVFGNS